MAKPETEHAEVAALEDECWRLKDVASDFYGRAALTGPDRAALFGATRDVRRIYDRLIAVRDKRKRKDGEGDDLPTTAAAPEQHTLEHAEGTASAEGQRPA